MWGKGKSIVHRTEQTHYHPKRKKGEIQPALSKNTIKTSLLYYIIISGQRDTLLCYKEQQRIVWILLLLLHQTWNSPFITAKIKLNKTTPHPFVLYSLTHLIWWSGIILNLLVHKPCKLPKDKETKNQKQKFTLFLSHNYTKHSSILTFN